MPATDRQSPSLCPYDIGRHEHGFAEGRFVEYFQPANNKAINLILPSKILLFATCLPARVRRKPPPVKFLCLCGVTPHDLAARSKQLYALDGTNPLLRRRKYSHRHRRIVQYVPTMGRTGMRKKEQFELVG